MRVCQGLSRKCFAESCIWNVRGAVYTHLATSSTLTNDQYFHLSSSKIISVTQPCTCFWVWFPWLHTPVQITNIWQDSSFCGNQTSHNTNWTLYTVLQERTASSRVSECRAWETCLGFSSHLAMCLQPGKGLQSEWKAPPILLPPPDRIHSHQEPAHKSPTWRDT